MSKRTILIIAGPNGAGKTTIAPALNQQYAIEEAINPDIIAAGLSLHPQSVAFQSGRIALNRLNQLIESDLSFSYETTLASHTLSMILNKIDPNTTTVTLHFFSLPSVEAAIGRVRVRVKQGGHDIPENVIRRRFYRGIKNFFSTYSLLVDEWVLYNGYEAANIIALSNDGEEPAKILDTEFFNLLKQYAEDDNG